MSSAWAHGLHAEPGQGYAGLKNISILNMYRGDICNRWVDNSDRLLKGSYLRKA